MSENSSRWYSQPPPVVAAPPPHYSSHLPCLLLPAAVIDPAHAVTAKTVLTMQNPDELSADAAAAKQQYEVTDATGVRQQQHAPKTTAAAAHTPQLSLLSTPDWRDQPVARPTPASAAWFTATLLSRVRSGLAQAASSLPHPPTTTQHTRCTLHSLPPWRACRQDPLHPQAPHNNLTYQQRRQETPV